MTNIAQHLSHIDESFAEHIQGAFQTLDLLRFALNEDVKPSARDAHMEACRRFAEKLRCQLSSIAATDCQRHWLEAERKRCPRDPRHSAGSLISP